jgi:hypothetical protein
MVVQIAVSLAWWPADQNIYRSKLRHKGALRLGRPFVRTPVEELLDACCAHGRLREVAPVDLSRSRIYIDREHRIEASTQGATCLPHS